MATTPTRARDIIEVNWRRAASHGRTELCYFRPWIIPSLDQILIECVNMSLIIIGHEKATKIWRRKLIIICWPSFSLSHRGLCKNTVVYFVVYRHISSLIIGGESWCSVKNLLSSSRNNMLRYAKVKAENEQAKKFESNFSSPITASQLCARTDRSRYILIHIYSNKNLYSRKTLLRMLTRGINCSCVRASEKEKKYFFRGLNFFLRSQFFLFITRAWLETWAALVNERVV